MKNKLIKAILVLFLCIVMLTGCSVVPSSTPSPTPTPVEPTPTPITTPTPTPEPTPIALMTLLYQNRTKVDYPLWLKDVPSTQRIKISFYAANGLIDFDGLEKELDIARRKGASEKEIEVIRMEYLTVPIKTVLKKYGLEDQLNDGGLIFTNAYSCIEFPVVDLDTLYKMVLDPDVIDIRVEYRELENGEWVSAWLDER